MAAVIDRFRPAIAFIGHPERRPLRDDPEEKDDCADFQAKARDRDREDPAWREDQKPPFAPIDPMIDPAHLATPKCT
jgi:hypothetical protein